MNRNIFYHILAATFLVIISGCEDTPKERITCDMLETAYYDEVDDITKEQQNAADYYNSLAGDWSVNLNCTGILDEQTSVSITQIDENNIEFYQDLESSECDSHGKAMFEMTFSASSNSDLSNKTFVMTADLSNSQDDKWLLVSSSEYADSKIEGLLSSSVQIKIDKDEELSGYLQIITEEDVANSGSFSHSTGPYCTFDQWTSVTD